MSRPQVARAKARPRVARRASASKSVRVVVADAQAIDRGGLVGLLEDERDLEVVGEAATVAEAIRQCRALEPDVMLLSLNLPGQERVAAITAIRADLPDLRIVALSERSAANCLVLNPPSRQRLPRDFKLACETGMDCLQLAITQGAMATVRRDADPEDLFRAVRAAAAGRASYDSTTAARILSATEPDRQGHRVAEHRLSQRELEVAAMIVEGQSNKEISTGLKLSEPTVKKHIGRILAKLGAADRLQAGLMLARNPTIFKR